MKRFEIPVSMIRQFLFCPRAAWHLYWLNRKVSSSNSWIERGRIFHNKQIRNYNRRKTKNNEERILHYQENLNSDSLGIFGVADLVVEYPKYLDIIEFKSTKGSLRSAKIQAGAYGLIAQETFEKEVKEIIIFCGDHTKAESSDFNQELSDEILKNIDLTRNCLELDILPWADPPLSKCGQCEFIRWCNDRF